MYELKAGSARLINALRCIEDDPNAINRMAAILDYLPEQLRQDIQALSDRYDDIRMKETEDIEA